MLPEAFVAHVAPGRLRVKIPGRKGSAEYFTGVGDLLRSLPGVESLRLNEVTGSVLLEGNVRLEDLSAHAEAKGLFRLCPGPPPVEAMCRRISGGMKDVDRVILDASSGQFGLSGAVFLGLAAAGFYQLSVGNLVAPAWYTAFWYAFGVYSKFLKDDDTPPPGSDG